MPDDNFAISISTKFMKMEMDDGGIIHKVRNGAAQTRDAAIDISNRFAPECENYMKNNAPWTDRTGNARNGLAARAYEDGDEIGIVLYHQVDYGIWLETRFSGEYAIIQPTIDEMGPIVMRAYERLLDRM